MVGGGRGIVVSQGEGGLVVAIVVMVGRFALVSVVIGVGDGMVG